MAGDWIKMEAATPDKAEVLAITAAMGWDDPDLAVGKLFRLWRWFDQQTTDGNAPGVTVAMLDHVVGVTGFALQVERVGWLSVSDDGVTLPNFDRHNGKTAKARALTAKRVAKHKSGTTANATGNAPTVTSGVSVSLPREEKRREETILPHTQAAEAPSPLPAVPDFAAAERVLARMKASPLIEVPPVQMCVAWVGEFGEELITETLDDAENEYGGKGWKYFEKILCSRRDHPEKRPANRRRPNPVTERGTDDHRRNSSGSNDGAGTARPSKLGRFKPRNGTDVAV